MLIRQPGEALTVTPEDLRLMIDVNVGPALWLTQAVVPYLRDRGSGSIVHVTARPGLEPTAGMAASPSARRPWSTSPACSTWSCARSASG